MLIKYRDDRYSMGHMALFPFLKAGFGISYNAWRVFEVLSDSEGFGRSAEG